LPEGSPYDDLWQLCYARCQATSKFLEEQGIAPQRMRLSQAGGYEPYSNRAEPESQARNSRVEVALLNELAVDLNGSDDPPDEQDAAE
jgi:flagellar motor protein MotB